MSFWLRRPDGEPNPKQVVVFWPGTEQLNPWELKKFSANPGRCLPPGRWENSFWILVMKYDDARQKNTIGRNLESWESRLGFGPRLLARALHAGGAAPVHIGSLRVVYFSWSVAGVKSNE